MTWYDDLVFPVAAAVGWDILCDKHLIIGVFKHGYGRLDLIKDDPTLIFESRVKQALSEMEGVEEDGPKRPKTQQSNTTTTLMMNLSCIKHPLLADD